MKNKNQLSDRIMRRVYFIWFGKKVLPYLAVETAVFAFFMYLIGHNVYVARVIEYTAQILAVDMAHPQAFLPFAMGIFIRTRFVVQLSVLGSLLMMVLLFKNIIASVVQLAFAKETKLIGRTF